MKQSKYKILTKNKFESFSGIKKTISSIVFKLTLSSGNIICGSPDHKIVVNNKQISFADLEINQQVSLEETLIEKEILSGQFPVYTIQGVESGEFLINKEIVSKNCAFIPENIFDEFYSAVYPTISSGKETKIIMISTANGLNHFYSFWNDAIQGLNNYKPFRVDWWDVPGRDQQWAKETISDIGQARFDKEFGNEFFGKSSSVVPSHLLKTLKHKNPLNSSKQFKMFEPPIKGNSYIGIIDVAEGVGEDYSTMIIIKIPTEINVTDGKLPPYEVVFVFKSNEISIFQFQEFIFEFATKYNEALLLIEVNVQNIAETLYRDFEYEYIIKTTRKNQKMATAFFSKDTKFGIKTTETVKRIGLELLIRMIEEERLIINDIDIIKEFFTLVRGKKTFEAKKGCFDDLCIPIFLFAFLTGNEGFKEYYDTENFKAKLKNDYLESASDELASFFVEDGINNNY